MTADLHGDALARLRAWAPTFTDERDQVELRDEYIDFLGSHELGHLKKCDEGHVTASALVVDPVHERVLLTLHPKVSKWLQLGGHLEADDASLLASAAREAREESGIQGLQLSEQPVRLDKHLVPCRPGVLLFHYDIQFVAIAPPMAAATISEESLDLKWFDWNALPDTDDSVRNLLSAARAFLARKV